MTVRTFHLAELPRTVSAPALVRPSAGTTPGLDHAECLAAPRTISTFSVWPAVQGMEEMVRGRSAVPEPERHATAMAERARRDFHHEFATYRFRPISEHGAWEERTQIVPPRAT